MLTQVSHTPLTPRSQFPARPSITGPRNQSSNTLSTKAIQTSGEISPNGKGDQVKRNPCLVLKTDKQLTVPPGIFQHVIPPATASTPDAGISQCALLHQIECRALTPKKDTQWLKLTSRTKVHSEEHDICSTHLAFLVVFGLFRCFTELKQLGASQPDRSSFGGAGFPVTPPSSPHPPPMSQACRSENFVHVSISQLRLIAYF